jgi:hypothetical protein
MDATPETQVTNATTVEDLNRFRKRTVLAYNKDAKLAFIFSSFRSAAVGGDFAPEPFASGRRFSSDSAAMLPFGKNSVERITCWVGH